MDSAMQVRFKYKLYYYIDELISKYWTDFNPTYPFNNLQGWWLQGRIEINYYHADGCNSTHIYKYPIPEEKKMMTNQYCL